MQPLFDLLPKEIPKIKDDKVQFEFQALCLELQEYFGKQNKSRIWSLPYQVWFNETKAWRALDITKKAGVKNINYFIGVLKKLKF